MNPVPPDEPYAERPGWSDLPPGVRGWVEQLHGEPVVRADSQRGGFSPGTADRVVTTSGRRAFVKAVSTGHNPDSPGLLSREADVLRVLPDSAGAPDLLGVGEGEISGQEWVVLVLEDVEGRHPRTPWEDAEVVAALDLLDRLAADPVPAGTGLPRLAEEFEPVLGPQGAALLEGDALVHLDVRSDNLLVTPHGGMRLIDWPWACVGAPWVDSLLLLLNVRLFGAPDVSRYLPRVHALGADDATIDAVLAGLAGFFGELADQPPPRGLPTIRAFQRAQAAASIEWVRERVGTES
ncbi:aminoglycoside phosphotransferase family protein [Ornithinicoccus hortensis]|uniref:Phosphotransferase family enzyme n=1 Tax=Ornithinicoccus hortensis TaxID=82346 RepID=A0A542YSB5_9MICO|nr:aminoglycoside phosphotransferase family protein [Ornithinicoccus hortensis]TQL50986.1 hypothetical protein FB467_2113 [Ornithinicoccus hortensis]